MDDSLHAESYVTAPEAIAILGVKLPTLYSYVSRGLVRSVPGDGRRARRYARADLERLRGRRDARAGHAALARAALDWGEPVLDSALTEITEQGPTLRGHLAIELVERDVTFEQAAELLWTGALPPVPPRWIVRTLGPRPKALAALLPRGAPPFAALQLAMATIATADATARVLLPRLAASLALALDPERATASLAEGRVAATILRALGGRPSRARIRAIDAALVLSIDHELNPSSFAARVAASAGADDAACLTAALATLSGARHGGMCDRVEDLVDAIDGKQGARRAVEERLARGDSVPGFGHRLYPRGDPRAALLIDVARGLGPPTPRLETLLAVVRAMHDRRQEAPTLDAGLVAIAAALGLPRGSAIALFALGRTAGWIAHAAEQRQSGQVLRPRARYVGNESPDPRSVKSPPALPKK
jgi:citrate synthase